MTFSFKELGNFSQFWKEEIANLFYVLWIAFYGACMIILIEFKKNPDKLNAMLPSQIPTQEHPYAKPYSVSSEDKANMGMLTYLFSYDSDFPYNLKLGIEMIDGYFMFFGGMGSYLYASYRGALKSMINILDVDNDFVDLFSFYILPTLLFYVVLMPFIPIVAFCGINYISCFYQERLKKAYIYAFAAIFNLIDYNSIKSVMDLTQFPQSMFFYFINVMLGFAMSYMFVPGISGLYSLAVWVYMIGFVKLMPFALIFLGGLSVSELGSKILDQFGKHYIGLSIIFLFYSIAICYKNLDQKVAWGAHITIIILILILLNVIIFMKQLWYYIYHSFKGDIKNLEFPNPFAIIGKELPKNLPDIDADAATRHMRTE